MKFWNNMELREIQNMVGNKFIDTQKKEIGDRVMIIDTSSVSGIAAELDAMDYQDLIDADNKFIVIANREKAIYHSYFQDYAQDLIIVDTKSNIQYRVISNHVRVL